MSPDVRLSSQQLKEFLQNISNEIKGPGGKLIGFKDTVILGRDKWPILIDLFYRVTPTPERRVIRTSISHKQFEKTDQERKRLNAAKALWKLQMKGLFNQHKDWYKHSRKLGINNVPENPNRVCNLIESYQSYVA